MTVIWVIFNQYAIYRLRKTQFQSDYDLQSPSDYAILINALPPNTTKDDIKDMIMRRNNELSKTDQKDTKNLKIRNIILPKKLDDYY